MTDELYSIPENADLTPIDDVSSETILDQLKGVISKKVSRPSIFIDVPERPGVKLLVSPNITQNQLRSWQRNCGSETKNGLDAIKFACTVIGHTTKGIYLNGEEVNEGGHPLGFASPSVMKMTGAERAIPDAVQNFFGLDPHLESAALAIIDAAGYGDTIEAEQENPTK
jgi:hypothetical protein